MKKFFNQKLKNEKNNNTGTIAMRPKMIHLSIRWNARILSLIFFGQIDCKKTKYFHSILAILFEYTNSCLPLPTDFATESCHIFSNFSPIFTPFFISVTYVVSSSVSVTRITNCAFASDVTLSNSCRISIGQHPISSGNRRPQCTANGCTVANSLGNSYRQSAKYSVP